MKVVLIGMLTLSLAAPAVAAETISQESIQKAVALSAAAVQNGSSAPKSNGKVLVWSGLSMAAAGGTLAALAASALKTETCGVVSYGLSLVGGCVEETNKGLLWTGIGLAGAGATLMLVGGSRSSSLQFGPGSLAYTKRF